MSESELTPEQRRLVIEGLRSTREGVERAIASLERNGITLRETLALVMDAVQPAHQAVQDHVIFPMWIAHERVEMPFPADRKNDYVNDALHLLESARRIAEIATDA